MNLNKKISIILGLLVVAIVVVGWKILAQGGLLSVDLPKPTVINTADYVAPNNGSVLGETQTSDYSNPLNDIYVNPFAK